MTRAELVGLIQQVAARLGGDVGQEGFRKETGVSAYELKMAGTWNELKREAGLATRDWGQARLPSEAVYEALARIIARDHQWPTELAIIRQRRLDRSVPSKDVIRRVRAEKDFAAKLAAYCDGRPEFSDVPAIALAQSTATSEEPSGVGDERVRGYVYMMRYGRRYKIGKTNSPTRRHREVRFELPDPTILVHTIETDDPSGIEKYWHERFAAKRVRDTEFFELDARDVAAFKRRRYQ